MREQLTEIAVRFTRAVDAMRNGPSANENPLESPSEEVVRTLLDRGTLRRDGTRIVHDEEVAAALGLTEFDYS